MASGDARFDEHTRRLEDVGKLLEKNTSMTREVLDLFDALKNGIRVLGSLGTIAQWLGKLALALGALVTAWNIWRHGGRPPTE